MKNIPKDKELYEKVKIEVYKQYDKPSAYRSGKLVQEYKKEFLNKYGPNIEPYFGDKEKGDLSRWFKEGWIDYAGLDYPTFRPSKRISSKTPLTVYEVEPENLITQAIEKQKIKGKKNLKPFKEKLRK
jgi:hypothetical protein